MDRSFWIVSFGLFIWSVYLAHLLLVGDVLSGSMPNFDILPLVEILSQIAPKASHPDSSFMIIPAPYHHILRSHFV